MSPHTPAPTRRTHRRRATALLAGAAALAVALAGGGVAVDHQRQPLAAGPLTGVRVADAPKTAVPKPATPKRHVAPAPVYSVAQVAKLVSPGAVVINSTLGGQNAIAAGTGMVLTASGEILTNNHVVDGATSITVTTSDGRRYDADLVGTAVSNDVALLQLRGASALTVVPLATSDAVSIAASVVAIGNAGGTGTLSVVSGIVTSTDRTITASDANGTSSERLSGMIEVKAPIRAGDSGGPLANRSGKVIGMDTAASSSRTPNPNEATYGFAIPINRALAVAQAIRSARAGGAAGTRGYLGIEVRGSDPATNVGGAIIVGVTPQSPASRAGLVPGDTITDIDGQIVTSANSLTQTLQNTKPGQHVRVGWVDASGQTHHAVVTLANGPAD